MYAIVKAGGRQEKVSVGETLVVDRLEAAIGSSVTFPAVLLVDGADVTTDPKALAAVKVTGEVLAEQKGPKIAILRYKSKTGYRRRQGYRSKLTRVKITGINKKLLTKAGESRWQVKRVSPPHEMVATQILSTLALKDLQVR